MVITGASMPQVLVWEGDSAGIDYSGVFIRDTLPVVGDMDVTYTTNFPSSFNGYESVFLSFGNYGAAMGKTTFNSSMAAVVQGYLEGGGSLYLEGGDALGEDLAGIDNDTLLSLLGIESVSGGYDNPIDALTGQASTVANGMLFTASTQEYSQYIDRYTPGTGTAAFIEINYDTVAVQHTGSYGQRTFVFSYVLAELVDGASSPSTKSDLLGALLDFFVGEAPPLALNDSVITLEDSAATIMVLENDIDPNGDPLVLTDLTHAIHGEAVIDPGDTTVTYMPNPNFNGSDTFAYIVSDGNGGLDTGTVEIIVTQVNDAPGNFAILTPAGDSTLDITNENLTDILTFSWESAEDVDGDSVWYCFDATGTLAAIVPSGDTSATELKLAYSGLVPLIREAGESGRVTGTWTIKATDGTDTTRAANGLFGLTLDISRLGVDGQDDIPKEFALRQNYPNPFNPSTTLRFALPRAVEVRLVVVDLLGREIARLVDGHLPAGFHQVIWDGKTHWGKEAPSGMYIVRLLVPPTAGAAPGFVRQVKMVLLK